ncbi:MAG: hypothetical protein ACK5MP_12210 [Nostocoides sp.]
MTAADVTPRMIADVMVSALCKEIRDGDVLGVGLGTPLAVLAGLVARKSHAPNSHLLVGGAVDPDADFSTVLGGPAAVHGHTSGFVPHVDTMGMAESRTMTVQILRPAQIDAAGNLNTSRIGGRERPSVRFPGGLATADVPRLLPRLVVYLPGHRVRNLPERVACITGSGLGWSGQPPTAGVTVAVTDLAVIEFANGAGSLRSVHPWVSRHDVAESTGFSFPPVDEVAVTPLPTDIEARVLEALDPSSLRERELRRL